MVELNEKAALSGLEPDMSDRAMVKHLSRGGLTVLNLERVEYLEDGICKGDFTLPGRSLPESKLLVRKAILRIKAI